MGLQIGGIDVADSALNSEFRIAVLERIVEKLIAAAPPGTVTELDLMNFRNEATQELQRKYPGAGITRKL